MQDQWVLHEGEILEYCDSKDLIKREQYYINLLKPKYNIMKIAGSRLGSGHTEETRAKMSILRTGKKHSEETKAKMSSAQSEEKNPMFGIPRPEGAGKPNQSVLIIDLEKNI
jgi:group I intron endonuclease